MKVAMVMPMTPESAIADVMNQAVQELSLYWDIHIWCPAESSYRRSTVPVTAYPAPDSDLVAMLGEYDLVVYVLGDSPLHSRVLPLVDQVPGLVIAHDASLTNLVRSSALQRGTFEALLTEVERTFGSDRARMLKDRDNVGGTEAWLAFCAEVPLTARAFQNSLGAVVHSQWHARQIDGLTLGEVVVAPLPVPSMALGAHSSQGSEPARSLAQLPSTDLLVITVGAVNANRHIDVILRAIAEDELLSRRVHLWAVGSSDGPTSTDLLRLARNLGLQERFFLTGRVSDSVLSDVLARADIAVALRSPVLEGMSGSLLTQMEAGIPVIVYNQAHYAELPDDVAVKVDPSHGSAGVRAALRQLLDAGSDRAARGIRSSAYVASRHTGAKYASAILDAGELALAAKPRAYLSADLGAQLRRLNLHREPGVVEVVADLAFDLFDLA